MTPAGTPEREAAQVPALAPTERFGERAQDYARARPGYPPDIVPELGRCLGLSPPACIVDLGCGTGLSSAPFLRAGYRVIGVEPNEAMRRHALSLQSAWPALTVRDGRAEATGLDDACADLVIAAQAFHWFDVPAARAEALRILRRPARAALIWNDRRDAGSDFATGYEALVRRFSPDYLEIRHRHGREDRVAQFFGAGRWREIRIAHADLLDSETLAQRLSSASYMPTPASPLYPAMMAELQALFAATAADGRVRMEFETRVLYGEIAPL
jgi:SAM-dependent methyltransferase